MTMAMTIETMLFVDVCGNKRMIKGPLWNFNVAMMPLDLVNRLTAVGRSNWDVGRSVFLWKVMIVSFVEKLGSLKSDDCPGRWWTSLQWGVRRVVSEWGQKYFPHKNINPIRGIYFQDYFGSSFSLSSETLPFWWIQLAHTYNLCWIEQNLCAFLLHVD